MDKVERRLVIPVVVCRPHRAGQSSSILFALAKLLHHLIGRERDVAVKRVDAHSYQRIGTLKNSGQFGKWDPTTYTVEDSLFGTIEFHNGGILRLETSFALNIPEQSIMNVNFCGDLAGATLFPAQVYTDRDGALDVLLAREMADDNRHYRSMEAFVNHVQGEPVTIADAEQGVVIQQLVAALYQSAETGTYVDL